MCALGTGFHTCALPIYILRFDVLRQPVAPVGRRGLAADQRFEVAAGGGGDAVAVPADEAGGHLLLAIGDLRPRGGFALPAVGRWEGRRGGKECVSTCRSRGEPWH